MDIKIVGDGIFGKFLTSLFSGHVNFTDNAENIILAVPADAYSDAAEENRGKHLINVCSIQFDTNNICLKYTDHLTGLHPLFGPQSSNINRTAILTHSCSKTGSVLDIFRKLEVDICEKLPDGRKIDGELHDRIMAVTHLAGLRVSEQLKAIVENASWVPENLVPSSFKRIRDFVKQCRDFSPGTVNSIKANPFGESNEEVYK